MYQQVWPNNRGGRSIKGKKTRIVSQGSIDDCSVYGSGSSSDDESIEKEYKVLETGVYKPTISCENLYIISDQRSRPPDLSNNLQPKEPQPRRLPKLSTAYTLYSVLISGICLLVVILY